MLRFFKSNNPLILILLPIISVLFSMRSIFTEVSLKSAENSTFLSGLLLNSIQATGYAEIIYIIISSLLLTAASFMILAISKNIKLFEQRNFLHAFIFLFIAGSYVQLPEYLPVITSGILLLFALAELLDALKGETGIFPFFNIGFFTALSSLFYFNSIYLIIPILAGKILIRPQNPKEWISIFIGLILPYFFLISIFFIVKSDLSILQELHTNIQTLNTTREPSLPYKIFFGYFGITALISSLLIFGNFTRLNIETRDFIKIFILIFITSAIILILNPAANIGYIFYIALSLNIPVTYWLNKKSRQFIKELVFTIFIALLIFAQTAYDIPQISFLSGILG